MCVALVGAGAGSAGALGASCSAKDVVVDVPIAAYVPAACGNANGAQVTFTGLGDYPQTSQAAETVALGSTGFALTALPPDAREVVLSPLTDASAWSGTALVPDAGPLGILTLPLGRACHLTAPVNLAGDPGAAVGPIDPTHVLLVGGTVPPFVVDLGDGAITQLAQALMPPRDYATVSLFGGGVLIAGGADPTTPGEQAQATAVVYTPGASAASLRAGTFSSPINLPAGQRKQHAAVTLADGRTLLVGGVSDDGSFVTAIEVFDPTKAGSNPVTILTTAALHVPRTSPTVLALSNGEVLIGGGFGKGGTPVASVEWLAPDLSWIGSQLLCSAGSEQGFAATEGGAVLAVMGPSPATATCSNVHLLRPSAIEEAPALVPPPLKVRLFPGAQASPVLVTDASTLRWNPWSATFAPLAQGAAGLSLPTTAYLAPSPGLALWLGEDGNVWTLRFDTHGVYATDFAHGPYLITDDLFTAPDRLPGSDVSFTVAGGASLANGATVWLTDATFEHVAASVTLRHGGAAEFVLRDPSGDEATCAVSDAPPGATVQVVRTGPSVTVGLGDASATTCKGSLGADVRVAVGLRGPKSGMGTSEVQALTVER